MGDEEAIRKLWYLGILSWKLHSTQEEIYESFYNSTENRYIIVSSRRLGKSYMMCVLALEHALRNPGHRICFAAPTQKAVKKIIKPIMTALLKDCPTELKPLWKDQDHFEFHNGSVIDIAGTDSERAETLRGQSMNLGLVDEAGFMTDLHYVVSDILMPQTLTTGGRIIIASTPPKTPAHDFTLMANDAKIKGNFIKKTIYDNPMIKKQTIIEFMMDSEPKLTKAKAEEYYALKSGPKNATWLREYMAEFVKDEELAIIPEFDDELKKKIVKEMPLPPFFDAYASMDIGYNDFTFVVFGYWDFLRGVLVIQDEVIKNKINSGEIARLIKDKEQSLWLTKPPFMRFSDVDPIILSDMQHMHGLTFCPTQKDNKDAVINKLRNWFKNEKIIINPRCVNLILHLDHGIWNKQKTKFERSGEFGHFDGVDALAYLVRNVNTTKNPIPVGYGLDVHSQYVNPIQRETTSENAMKKAFSPTRFFPNWKK